MIDFHSHVLPGIDDGARSTDDSIALLRMMSEQGVDHLALTPHFYAHRSSPESFLQKRAASYDKLRSEFSSPLPEIRLGAEVLYYPGISRMEQLGQLCLCGTKLLLLEMPMIPWRDAMVSEVLEIQSVRGVSVVLAHIERYEAFKQDDVLDVLLESGVMLQTNAESLLAFRTRKRVLNMLQQGAISFIGSDCHNTVSRPPLMREAWEYLRKKAGGQFLQMFEEQNLSYWEGKL